MRRVLVLALAVPAFLFVCWVLWNKSSQPTSLTAPAPTTESEKRAPATEPADVGNGVFYFPVTGDEYITALSKFYEGNGRHCDLQGYTERVVIRGAGQTRTQHTETTGFILHCHDMAIDAQKLTQE